MAGRGDRRATPRLVSGATVRMGFRGSKRAETCANRKDDQLGILSRCGCDDRLKTFTTSNHRTSPRRMSNVLPLSPMTADEYKQLPPEEKEHFFQCPKCCQFVDGRELRDVIFHVTNHKPKPRIPRIRGEPVPKRRSFR
jgi:hypothetical protein